MHFTFIVNIYLNYIERRRFFRDYSEVSVPIRVGRTSFLLAILHFAIKRFSRTSRRFCLSARFRSFARAFKNHRNKPPPIVNFEQDRCPSILTEIVQVLSTYVYYSVKLTTNNNDARLMIDRQKINVAAASILGRIDYIPFFSPLPHPSSVFLLLQL